MAEIIQKENEDPKQTYKKEYHQKLSDEKERILEYGATRLAEILYEQIITNAQLKKGLENK